MTERPLPPCNCGRDDCIACGIGIADPTRSTAPRTPRRQHIVDAVVEVAGVEKGGEVVASGLDWIVAEGLVRLGYRLVRADR